MAGLSNFTHPRNPVAPPLQPAIALQDPGGRGGLYYAGNLCLQAAYGAGHPFLESISEADAHSSPFHTVFCCCFCCCFLFVLFCLCLVSVFWFCFVFFQTKPMGFSSAWFPFHEKTSHTSSGTKHCIKVVSYSIETQRNKTQVRAILHWPFGKAMQYWECIRAMKKHRDQ